MHSRDGSDERMPSWPMAMPSVTVMVQNSRGVPPAEATPFLTAWAWRISEILQGAARSSTTPRRQTADGSAGWSAPWHRDTSGAEPVRALGHIRLGSLFLRLVLASIANLFPSHLLLGRKTPGSSEKT